MTVETQIWRGRQWVVTTHALRPHSDFYYEIEIDRLAETRPFSDDRRSDWLLHMAESGWVDVEDFITAWCVAVVVNKTKLGKIDVKASIEDARAIERQYREEEAEDRELAAQAGYGPDDHVVWIMGEGEFVPSPKTADAGT